MLVIVQLFGFAIGAIIVSLYTFLPVFRNLINAICILATVWVKRLTYDDVMRQRVIDELYAGRIHNKAFEEIRERTRREVRESLVGTSSTPNAMYNDARQAYILPYRISSSDHRYELVIPACITPRKLVAFGEGNVDSVVEAAGPLGNFHGFTGTKLEHCGVKEDVQLMDSATFSGITLNSDDDLVEAVRRSDFAY